MVLHEVLVIARDDHRDPRGTIVAVKPEGTLISSPEWNAWVRNDSNKPSRLADCNDHSVLLMERDVRRQRLLESLNGDHNAYYQAITGRSSFPEEEAMEAAALVDYFKARIAETGVDLNWGFEELKMLGALVFDIDPRKAPGLVRPVYDFGPSGCGTAVRSAYGLRVPVETMLSGKSWNEFCNIEVTYPVNRNFPNLSPIVIETL